MFESFNNYQNPVEKKKLRETMNELLNSKDLSTKEGSNIYIAPCNPSNNQESTKCNQKQSHLQRDQLEEKRDLVDKNNQESLNQCNTQSDKSTNQNSSTNNQQNVRLSKKKIIESQESFLARMHNQLYEKSKISHKICDTEVNEEPEQVKQDFAKVDNDVEVEEPAPQEELRLGWDDQTQRNYARQLLQFLRGEQLINQKRNEKFAKFRKQVKIAQTPKNAIQQPLTKSLLIRQQSVNKIEKPNLQQQQQPQLSLVKKQNLNSSPYIFRIRDSSQQANKKRPQLKKLENYNLQTKKQKLFF